MNIVAELNYVVFTKRVAATANTPSTLFGLSAVDLTSGQTASVEAYDPATGEIFDKWTTASTGVTFANATSASTTFAMPVGAVTVTATYGLEVMFSARHSNCIPQQPLRAGTVVVVPARRRLFA